MTLNQRLRRRYVLADLLAATVAIFLFDVIRHGFMERFLPTPECELSSFLFSFVILAEQIIFPLVWLGFAWLTGFYSNAIEKSRLQTFGNTLLTALLLTLTIYFAVLLNDSLPRRRYTYQLLLILYGLTASIPLIARFLVQSINGNIHRPSLIVGATSVAAALSRRISRSHGSRTIDIIGFVDINDGPIAPGLEKPVFNLCDLKTAIANHGVRALILAPSDRSGNSVMALVNDLFRLECPILISPDLYNPVLSRPRFSNVSGEPLVDISQPRVQAGILNTKRLVDVVTSSLSLILLSPLLGAIAIAVKLDSHGPVFYRQERLGYRRRPFKIVKFRSMFVDAEKDGPRLSSASDERVTKVGRILRKYRLDELPNFWNVLRGDMSLVGPRPEREHFVNRIVEKEPMYTILYGVRPGITSWGMVKYGYAETVEQMIERMRYDLLYVENISPGVDIKILFYTINTVITGRGV